jgi:predicted nucleic acid-binding protein
MLNSSTICCDANLVIAWASANTPAGYDRYVDEWLESGTRLIAPSLLHYEVTNVIWRSQRAGEITLAEAQSGLEAALSLPIAIVDDDELHLEAFAIARRFNLPASYDAHYLALAEREGVEFWTTDRRLLNAVQHEYPWARLAIPPSG